MLATGNVDVERSMLPGGEAGVDQTVEKMVEMAKGEYGARSAKIRALAINIINVANVPDKDYFGMIEAIHNWVRDQIRYVRDPVGQETLSYPEETAFNTKAEDCDGKSILEMALLGSLGIRSYPVVIGTVAPGVFTHVYIHVQVPPGKGRYAGKIIAADPIMREWPLGKEAEPGKVKAKKLYSELAGLGNMTIGAYATGPSYIDEQNVDSVDRALKSKLTDTGGRGRVMTTEQVLRPYDDLDAMFQRGAVRGPFQAASMESLSQLGPMTSRGSAIHTSFLDDIRPRKIPERRTGPKTVVIKNKKLGVAPAAADPAPTRKELQGLADYLSSLEPIARKAGQRRGVIGAKDVIYKAGAAVALANQRSRAATKKVAQHRYSIALFGLGAEVDATEANLADAVARLASTVADHAAKIAKIAAGTSPDRMAALRATVNKLERAEAALGSTSIVTSGSAFAQPFVDAAAKVSIMRGMALDKRISDLTDTANRTYDGDMDATIASSPVGVPMAEGSVVYDRKGNVLFDGTSAVPDGYNTGMAGFGSVLKKAVKKVTSTAKSVAKVAEKVVPEAHLAQLTKGLVKSIAQKDPLLKRIVAKSAITRKALGIKLQKKAPTQSAAGEFRDSNGSVITEEEYNHQMDQLQHDQGVYDSAIAAINLALNAGTKPGLTAEQILVLQKYDAESYATYQSIMAQPASTVTAPAPVSQPVYQPSAPINYTPSPAPYYPPASSSVISPTTGGSSVTPSYSGGGYPADTFGPDDIISTDETSASDASYGDNTGAGFDPGASFDSGSGDPAAEMSEQYDENGNLIMPENEPAAQADQAAAAAPAESGGFLPIALIGGAALYFFGKKH